MTNHGLPVGKKVLILISDGTNVNLNATNQKSGSGQTSQSAINWAKTNADNAKTGSEGLVQTEIYTIHFGNAGSDGQYNPAPRDFIAGLATGDFTIGGHQPGSKNEAGTSNDSTLIYNENHDGDHFYISPTSEEMADIFQIIGEEILEPSVNELPPTLVVITQVNNSSGTSNKTSTDFTITIDNPSPQTFQGSETGELRTLNPGDYNITSEIDPQYSVSNSPDCSGTIAAAETKTCVIIYTANPPPPPPIETQQNIDINSWKETS